jgi:hypothetical protein
VDTSLLTLNRGEQSYYDILDPRYSNLPTSPYPLTAESNLQVWRCRSAYYWRRANKPSLCRPGPALEPFLVAPAISLTVSPQAGVVPIGNATLHLRVTIHSSVKGPATGALKLELLSGWTSEPSSVPFNTAAYDDESIVNFAITPKTIQAKPYSITAVAESDGHTYKEGFEMAGYVGLRSIVRRSIKPWASI